MKVQNIKGNVIFVKGCTPLENLILSVLRSLHEPEKEFVRILQADICKIIGCSQGGLMRSMLNLENIGLIEREPNKLKNQIKGYKVVLPAQNDD
jgi:DNA-binding MarR family transcriptional regulator